MENSMSFSLEQGNEQEVVPLPINRVVVSDDSPSLSSTANYIPKKENQNIRTRFPIGERCQEFRKRFYPKVSSFEWNDWRWQVRNRVKHLSELEKMLKLSADERSAIENHRGSLPLGITPYYLALFDENDALQPLRRTHIPVNSEYTTSYGEANDPLAEDQHFAVPGLVHRYPDRVLFLTTSFCSTYCRYCTRSRVVGGSDYHFNLSQWEQAAQYIEAHPEIRDCLLSGGDPLINGDDKLDWLLGRLRRIKHLEFIRIGTKVPVVLPQRITPQLVKIFKKYHPLWMSINFTHPDELTPEVSAACNRLADAGIPLGSQTVLLKDINDDVAIMKSLMHGLLKIRVKPYYLYQCDPISGSSHFRTTVDKGLEIIRGLRGHTTGYAVPNFVVDGPGGGGKIPLLPDYIVGREGNDILLTNYSGKIFRYPDVGGFLGTSQNELRKKG